MGGMTELLSALPISAWQLLVLAGLGGAIFTFDGLTDDKPHLIPPTWGYLGIVPACQLCFMVAEIIMAMKEKVLSRVMKEAAPRDDGQPGQIQDVQRAQMFGLDGALGWPRAASKRHEPEVLECRSS